MTTPSPVIDPVQPVPRPRRRVWPWVALALAVLIPVMLTLAGALTSPPHVAAPPVGRIVFLDANQISERTTLLRGLSVLTRDGQARLLVHEQDSPDAEGPREWITQPAASPDGRQVAFIKQLITLKEEDRSVVNQLWAMPMDSGGKPKLLLDLTARKMKQVVGLTWTPDSKSVIFLNDATQYQVGATNGKVTQTPLANCPPLSVAADISATRNPAVDAEVYAALTDKGSLLIAPNAHLEPLHDPNVRLFALAPGGRDVALVRIGSNKKITFADLGDQTRTNEPQTLKEGINAQWGWSVFGGRKITSLKWSPDGKYLGYTVSKPPVPEDELFYLELATGKTFQLPIRCGRAAWDWSR